MTTALLWTAGILAGGLLGSIPFGLIVAKVATGADVRRIGSGNIGATNVLRASGGAAAAVTLLLDAGKGAVAVMLARLLVGPPTSLDDWAGFAAVAGHVLSPWLRLRGGKGVATAAGVLVALSPPLAAAGLAVFAVALAASRIVSLSSVLACLVIALLVGFQVPFQTVPPRPAVFGICALVLLRHRENLARLVKGREPQLRARHEVRS